ncbi:glutathione S-transferase [Mycena belliarum]|uniref:glutathione transferase n=1 Tax=Mycena belliarum TaxID=1033014 RepID=A0AAD6XS11_9AGAR|nr:glutathione S-transferase [Mycena belliae]
MVLKLYAGKSPSGDNVSPSAGSGLVALVLLEKKIPFEFIPVDLSKGEHKTPEYLGLHPGGRIPMIDDDGFILYESRAICRYLAEKYADQGTRLIPTDLRAKARFEQGASLELAEFLPQIVKVGMELVFKPRVGAPIDEAAVAEGKAALDKKLAEYEVILGKQKYIGGDEFTLADIFHLYGAPLLIQGGHDLITDKGPNVQRWWNDLVSRPNWIKLQEGIQGVATY